jgi:hypothetical protein
MLAHTDIVIAVEEDFEDYGAAALDHFPR